MIFRILAAGAISFMMIAAPAMAAESTPVPVASDAPACKTGKPCGDTCIAKDKACHVEKKKKPVCKTGKARGDSCIAKDKTCTK